MKRKINPTLIGVFVLGAVILMVIGVVILGSGRLFRNAFEALLYFEDSVNGLKEGASVKFKGVEIGYVSRILLQLGPDTKVRSIPVIVEIDRKKLAGRGLDRTVDDPKFIKAAIDQGLRGQLETESFVTGVLFVSLDFYPDTPANFVQPPGSGYLEIPRFRRPSKKCRVRQAMSWPASRKSI